MYILKGYKDNISKQDTTSAKVELFNYVRQLEQKGWIDDMMEGGVISPDISTIFYYNRKPYIGQLAQFRANAREQYRKTCENLKKDFIEVK